MLSAGPLRTYSQGRSVVGNLTDCWIGRSFASRFATFYQRKHLTESADLSNCPRHPNGLPHYSRERKNSASKEQRSLSAITAGVGARARAARKWKHQTRRGCVESLKLVEVVHRLSNVKEEIYDTLDALIAWHTDFPIFSVKKALKILAESREWTRVIQVSKWMLDKGQGKTLATYSMLLKALDHEGRVEEAEALWVKLLQKNAQCIPRPMFARMISMYERYGKPNEVLKVFVDMEQIGVKPDLATVRRVSSTYALFGYPEYAKILFTRKSFVIKGK